MKKLLLVFLIALSLNAGDSVATGQDYRKWDDSSRAGYVLGYLAGYVSGRERLLKNLATALTPPTWTQVVEQFKGKVDRGAACLSGREGNAGTVERGPNNWQLMAVLDKYIADHPERWDKPIIELAEEAFIEACEKRAKNP
jgi:hypothetical protein